MSKKFSFYKQLIQKDCGPTCLRMIAKYHGKLISVEKLRKYSELNKVGASLLGISRAAERIGFKTMYCRLSYDQLVKDAPTPCIIHWEQKHFVVVTPHVKNNNIEIADPAESIYKCKKSDFFILRIVYTPAGD